jgi:hypothetical protein
VFAGPGVAVTRCFCKQDKGQAWRSVNVKKMCGGFRGFPNVHSLLVYSAYRGCNMQTDVTSV